MPKDYSGGIFTLYTYVIKVEKIFLFYNTTTARNWNFYDFFKINK